VNSPEDDGICLKSSYGLGYARACDNVTITNCLVTARYEIGTLIDGTCKPVRMANKKMSNGRIKAGTESNGGFRNISISNCVFDHSRGLALESADGALLEDIVVSNITMKDCPDTPLFLRLCARMRGPSDARMGTLRRVKISHINSFNSTGLYPGMIAGIPGSPIEDISLSDIYIHKVGGADKAMADSDPDEQVHGYPDQTRFPAMLPAYGLFLRHVRNLEMSNIEFRLDTADARPAIWAHDVNGLDLFRLRTPATTGAATFALRDVSGFRVFGSSRITDRAIDKVDQISF
jgi:polygalacturonase